MQCGRDTCTCDIEADSLDTFDRPPESDCSPAEPIGDEPRPCCA